MVAACNAGMQTQSTQRLVRLPCAVPWSLVAGARARRAPVSCYYISFLLTRYALCDVRYVPYFLFSYI